MLLDPGQLLDNLATTDTTRSTVLHLLTLASLNSGDIKLAGWLAQNNNTNTEDLNSLADIPNKTIAQNLLKNPSINTATLQKILTNHPELYTTALTSSAITPTQIQTTLQKTNKTELVALTQNPNLDSETLQQIHTISQTHPDMYQIQQHIAANPNCGQTLLNIYKNIPELEATVAQNPNLDSADLTKLWRSGNTTTKQNLLKNPKCPPAIITSVLITTIPTDPDWTYMQQLAAKHPWAAPAALKTYWETNHYLQEVKPVLTEILKNPNCPTEILQQAAEGPYEQPALIGLLHQHNRTTKTLQQTINTTINNILKNQQTPEEKNETLETILDIAAGVNDTYPELKTIINTDTTWENLTNTLSSPITEETWMTTKTAIDNKLKTVALTDKWAVAALIIYGGANMPDQNTTTWILQELIKLTNIVSEKNRHMAKTIVKQTLNHLEKVASNKTQASVLKTKTLQQIDEPKTPEYKHTQHQKHRTNLQGNQR